jgi:hypothetical protein
MNGAPAALVNIGVIINSENINTASMVENLFIFTPLPSAEDLLSDAKLVIFFCLNSIRLGFSGLSCPWKQDFSIHSQPEQQELAVRFSQQVPVVLVRGKSGLLGSCPGLNCAAVFTAGYSRYDESLHIDHPLLNKMESPRYSLLPPTTCSNIINRLIKSRYRVSAPIIAPFRIVPASSPTGCERAIFLSF